MSVRIVIALIDLVVVIVLIIRRVDVRLVLLAAAVVAMSSKLAHVPPSSLIHQVVLPFAIGGATLMVATLMGLL